MGEFLKKIKLLVSLIFSQKISPQLLLFKTVVIKQLCTVDLLYRTPFHLLSTLCLCHPVFCVCGKEKVRIQDERQWLSNNCVTDSISPVRTSQLDCYMPNPAGKQHVDTRVLNCLEMRDERCTFIILKKTVLYYTVDMSMCKRKNILCNILTKL